MGLKVQRYTDVGPAARPKMATGVRMDSFIVTQLFGVCSVCSSCLDETSRAAQIRFCDFFSPAHFLICLFYSLLTLPSVCEAEIK